MRIGESLARQRLTPLQRRLVATLRWAGRPVAFNELIACLWPEGGGSYGTLTQIACSTRRRLKPGVMLLNACDETYSLELSPHA